MKAINSSISISVVALILGAGGSAVAQEPDAKLTSEIQQLPLTGVTLKVTKAVDSNTGEVHRVATDGAGKPIDPDQAVAAEERARVARYGKLDSQLAEKLAKLGPPVKPDLTLPVSIWVKGGDSAPNRPLVAPASVEAANAVVAARINQLREQTAPKRQSVVDALARMGVIASQADFSPVVFAELTAAQIRTIEKHPNVVTVYGQAEYTLFSDKASTTQRAYSVWLAGNTGRNVSARIVVHEPDGVADTNPYLNNLSHPVTYWCPRYWAGTDCSIGKNYGSHATEVAGVEASTHPLIRGMAPDAPMILSANTQDWSDAKLIRAAEWGIASGGAVTNMSWGTICGGDQDVQSRWVDWATGNLAHTFVISAGNHPAGCSDATNDEKVSSPGLAWSVITVGSIADNSTGFWTGDAMSGFSDWRNPNFATGMEKPEVVAVGQDVLTTDLSADWLTDAPGVNGTSFAAPMVAGQVAQLIARQPGQIVWPETNKAAVLVSAFHDIEAGTSRDGVGAVVMNISNATYQSNRFRNSSFYATTTNPQVFTNVINATVNQVIRVAIAWNSWSNGSTSDVLGADLDLVVKRGDTGAVVCGSYSVSNAWELCSFTAPVTGAYTVEVSRFSYTTGWPGTYLGVAWGVQSKYNFCSNASTLAATGGTVTVNTANGSTYFDSYPAPAPAWTESGRERVYKLVLATTRDITVTDNNSNLDLFVVQTANCAIDPLVPVVKGAGINSVIVDNAPAGTYYIVVDGYYGTVGSTTMNVSVTGP